MIRFFNTLYIKIFRQKCIAKNAKIGIIYLITTDYIIANYKVRLKINKKLVYCKNMFICPSICLWCTVKLCAFDRPSVYKRVFKIEINF